MQTFELIKIGDLSYKAKPVKSKNLIFDSGKLEDKDKTKSRTAKEK